METKPLATLEINTGATPSASVIWLHGLGADGHDFAPMASELKLPMAVRFILPHAPIRAVTINGGYQMPAWYDIVAGEITALQDEPGIHASQQQIEGLIRNERLRGIPAHRILLVGFSQGGAIALQTALRHAERLAGVIALSTYLPLTATVDTERSLINAGLPIFMGHGREDTVIAIDTARASRDFMLARHYPVAWHEYRMPHSVCTEEIADIRAFMLQALSEPANATHAPRKS